MGSVLLVKDLNATLSKYRGMWFLVSKSDTSSNSCIDSGAFSTIRTSGFLDISGSHALVDASLLYHALSGERERERERWGSESTIQLQYHI
jgi:hypothetical protein